MPSTRPPWRQARATKAPRAATRLRRALLRLLRARPGRPQDRGGVLGYGARQEALYGQVSFANVTLRRGDAPGAGDRADAARARAEVRGRARAAAREREAAARDGALPLPPAEALRRHGAAVRRGGRHRGRARARLPVDRVERRQPGLPPLDPRLLRAGDAARGVGRESRRADRLVDRARRGPGKEGRGRLRRERALAVLLRRRQLAMEHARRHDLRRTTSAVDWRLCLVPKKRLRDHRHLVRDGHGRHRQQGHRGEGGVRARAARARPRPLPRRPRASRRGAQRRAALPRADRRFRGPPAFGRPRSARPKARSNRSWSRSRRGSEPIPAPRSPTSRRCRSSSPRRAASSTRHAT